MNANTQIIELKPELCWIEASCNPREIWKYNYKGQTVKTIIHRRYARIQDKQKYICYLDPSPTPKYITIEIIRDIFPEFSSEDFIHELLDINPDSGWLRIENGKSTLVSYHEMMLNVIPINIKPAKIYKIKLINY